MGKNKIRTALFPTGIDFHEKRKSTLLDGTNVRLNWNIESDLNVYWIKFKSFLSLY
jgi:hypothetical protein